MFAADLERWLKDNYGWRENPFQIKPLLTSKLYVDSANKFKKIRNGIRRGIVVLVGSIGSGKTTTLRLLHRLALDRNIFVMYYGRPPRLDEFRTSLSGSLMDARKRTAGTKLIEFLGISSHRRPTDLFQIREYIKNFDRHTRRRNADVLILIDNAHRITQDMADELAVFYDLPNLHIIAAGTPLLINKMEEFHSLRDRISDVILLGEFSTDDIRELIESRVNFAGGTNPFGDDVIEILSEAGAAPRQVIVNINKILKLAMESESPQITAELARSALEISIKTQVRESFLDKLSDKKRGIVLSLFKKPDMTISEVAAEIDSKKYSTTNMVNKLIKEGFIEVSGEKRRARTLKVADKYAREMAEVVE